MHPDASLESPHAISQHPPALHISIPPHPLPHAGTFQLQTVETTPGGRPFAGAHPSGSDSLTLPQEGGPTAPFEYAGGEDMFGLSALDFSFESFIDFKEDHLDDGGAGNLLAGP